jgi:ribosomal protein S27E
MTDSEDKRDEIAQLYTSMSDLELKDLAEEAWSLTEIGKEKLRAELARRGLNVELDTVAPAEPEAHVRNLVAIRKFRDLPEALLAKGFLESAGIESVLVDETTIRMDWLWSNLLGGVKLVVKPQDVDAATQILNDGIPETFSVEGVGDFEQPRCPQCKSLDISHEESDTRWKCRACGHEWQSTDESKQDT